MPPLAVAAQGITERLLQWPEPRLVVTPLVETLAKDRLTHLLGTRRADAALGAVVVQARRLERQFAELEQAPDAAFKILDDVLVMDAQHPTRQHSIPMLHELEVSAVVAGDVLDAVSELLAAGVQLLEVPETAGHRLAARVDDLGVRQHQMNETDVPGIVRHLVDEARVSAAGDAGIGPGNFGPRAGTNR